MIEKYTPLKGTTDPKAGFSDLLGLPATYEKSILLFPGRWSGFDVKAAVSLSQAIVTTTTFKVFICTPAHPLANSSNARELSPLLTGVGLRNYVEQVLFFDGEVGLGKNILGKINYKLAENRRSFFFLRMKTFVKFTRQSPPPTELYFPVTIYTPTTYTPPPVNPTPSGLPEDFFLASFVKGGDKTALAGLKQKGISSYLIPDPDRNWPQYDIYQLHSLGQIPSKEFLKDLLTVKCEWGPIV